MFLSVGRGANNNQAWCGLIAAAQNSSSFQNLIRGERATKAGLQEWGGWGRGRRREGLDPDARASGAVAFQEQIRQAPAPAEDAPGHGQLATGVPGGPPAPSLPRRQMSAARCLACLGKQEKVPRSPRSCYTTGPNPSAASCRSPCAITLHMLQMRRSCLCHPATTF